MGGDEKRLRSRLHEIRTERGFTIEELAFRANLAPGSVGKLDRDAARRIDLTTLGKLCSALDVEPGDLFELR